MGARLGLVLRVTGWGVAAAAVCGPGLGALLALVYTATEPSVLAVAVLFCACWGFVLGVPVGAVMGAAAGTVLAALVGSTSPERAALGASVLAPVLCLLALAPLLGGAGWLVASAVPVTAVAAYPMWRVTVSAARSFDARAAEHARVEA